MALVELGNGFDVRVPASSSWSFNYTNPSASDTLVVIVSSPGTSINSVTYGGDSMTQKAIYNTAYGVYWGVYFLTSPKTGTNSLQVNLSGANFNSCSSVIYSFSGSNGVGNIGFNNTQASPQTTSLTISSNSMIIGACIGGNSTAAYIEIPQGTTRTVDWNHNINNFTWGGISPSLTSGTKTIEGGSTATNIIMGVEVKEAPTPILFVSPSSLTGFTYVEGSGPSTEQSFALAGQDLTANTIISAPTNYEISKTSGGPFSSSITETATTYSYSVYVRLKSGLTAGTYNGEIINITSTGATSQTVTLDGNVTAPLGKNEGSWWLLLR